jgi:hypothetical protein
MATLESLKFNDIVPEASYKALSDQMTNWAEETFGSSLGVSSLVDVAMYLALDSVVTLTTTVATGKRYCSSPGWLHLNRTKTAIGKLLSKDGMEIQEFRELAFMHLLPDFSDFHKQDLIVSHSGYVVGMSALWKPSTRQGDVFTIRYAAGYIEKGGVNYEKVREADLVSSVSPEDAERISLFEDDKYSPIVPRKESFTFETRTAEHGSHLLVKHYMRKSLQPSFGALVNVPGADSKPLWKERRASWIGAICALATAIHIDDNRYITPAQEEEVARRLHRLNVPISWSSAISVYHFERGGQKGTRYLLKSCGDEMVRFFATSWVYDPSLRGVNFPSYRIVVRHNASILSSIVEAERDVERFQPAPVWVIIC